MSDPYKILGVSPSATDDEIKSAYRELAKKYHPDNYSGSPIADLAGEKMKEINEAYDAIVAERKRQKNGGGVGSGPYAGTGYDTSAYGNPGYGAGYSNVGSSFSDVRNLIVAGRIADAEQILNGVPAEVRNAEWYFLKGTVLYKRGWLEEAYNNFSRACQMDPNNAEYRAAMNQVTNQRNGVYGGYNPDFSRTNSCSSCDACSSLLCADCCCECMGGDLVPCC